MSRSATWVAFGACTLPGQRDPLLRATRIAMVPMTLLAIVIAIYVKQTGILLTLAFDLLLACLVVPFILGLVWRRGTSAAALVSIVVGLTVRLVLFVMTPTMYGLDNTILYIPNGVDRRVVRRMADVHRLRRRRWSRM